MISSFKRTEHLYVTKVMLSVETVEKHMITNPLLDKLPPPKPGKKGWPWTEESRSLPETMPDGKPWPKISFVTPSYNQGRFLEETIRSVLLQGYPALEYYVVDGGSTDESVEIIEKYAPFLTGWVSEPDGGQSDAINKGLRKCSGLLAGWVNSDDMLHKDALFHHAQLQNFRPDTIYVGKCAVIDNKGMIQRYHEGRVTSLKDLLQVRRIWRAGGHIVQPEVLFPLEAARRLGFLNVHNHHSMDFELWARLLMSGAVIEYTGVNFGVFRRHESQKTTDRWTTTKSLIQVALDLLEKQSDWTDEENKALQNDLLEYKRTFWRDTGRLARWGVPEPVVLKLRSLRTKLNRPVAR